MKTAEEFYKEIADSKELQEELKNASNEMLEAFLRKHGCDASGKAFAAFVDAHREGAIDDEDAQTVAGGIPIF